MARYQKQRANIDLTPKSTHGIRTEAELKAIADYAQGVLGRAVRIGRPAMPGLPEAHSGPAFSTLAGLAQFAASDALDLRTGFASPGAENRPQGNMLQRLIATFRTQY